MNKKAPSDKSKW